ncbi:hypothetical protein [Natronolimnobius baerhuensis]|uniref:Uncharacterized protein n=1 Tax=Natronolimnobius baerhuensis TaxID=253108 RepID=A0A202E6K2_9EURY|nr:hypothetical protein [Natronolimnobius baerhuensis]OVE83885.1 hypothetical protein B2G88_15860 [Natronolimnobius baerhuensis]
MRVSVPGVPGVYYDTDTGTTAMATAFSLAGRTAPKPKGYALQALPYLWSFEVDLHEVPNTHPIQYLHPEGAQSLGALSPDQSVRQAGIELEAVLRFAWEVNREVETATNSLIGRAPEDDGVVIEIEDGSVNVGGDELETDEFDLEDESTDQALDDVNTGADADTDAETDGSVTETDSEFDGVDDGVDDDDTE